MKKIIPLVYIVIGVVVAWMKDYLGDVGSLGDIINLLLAILLWPLVLLGVEFNLSIGDGDKGDKGDKGGGKDGDGGGKKGTVLMLGPALTYARVCATRGKALIEKRRTVS